MLIPTDRPNRPNKEPRTAGLFFILFRHLGRRSAWYAAAGLLILAWLAFAPGLDGPFLYDDHPNIASNESIKIDRITPATLAAAIESGRAGPLGRPISMASFAIDHARAGLNPSAFKRINLLIHLLCGLLVAGLSFLLTSRIFWRDAPARVHMSLALLVAAVWLTHPLQVTNVLYVVQRMNSLAGLFTLAALLCYVATRFTPDGRLAFPGPISLGAIALLTACAALSKENGVLVIAYVAAIELSARYALQSPARDTVDRFFLAIMGFGILLIAILLATFHERLLALYINRDFTLGERLLTQPRVLLWYLKLMVLPNITEMGLIHDYWVKSTGLLQPATTLAAMAFWLFAGALAWLLRFRAPLLLFGLLWFLLGHSLESTVWPLLLVFEHRNYLPLFGIVLVLCVLITQILYRQPALAKAIPAIIVIAVLYHQTRDRARIWSEDTVWIQAQAQNHPNSPAAQYLKGDLFAQFAGLVPPEHREKVIDTADQAFQHAWELRPEDISPLLARTYQWARLGLPVSEDDLRRAASQIERGHVPIPAQNAVLTFCEQIRDDALPGAGDLHKKVLTAMLGNPVLSRYIHDRLKTCEKEVSSQRHARNNQ